MERNENKALKVSSPILTMCYLKFGMQNSNFFLWIRFAVKTFLDFPGREISKAPDVGCFILFLLLGTIEKDTLFS